MDSNSNLKIKFLEANRLRTKVKFMAKMMQMQKVLR